jgi:hypothetical protein
MLDCKVCRRVTKHSYDGKFALDMNLKRLPTELRNKKIYTCTECCSSRVYESKEREKEKYK